MHYFRDNVKKFERTGVILSLKYCLENAIAITLRDCAELLGIHQATLKRAIKAQTSNHPKIIRTVGRDVLFELEDAVQFKLGQIAAERKRVLKKAFDLEKTAKMEIKK